MASPPPQELSDLSMLDVARNGVDSSIHAASVSPSSWERSPPSTTTVYCGSDMPAPPQHSPFLSMAGMLTTPSSPVPTVASPNELVAVPAATDVPTTPTLPDKVHVFHVDGEQFVSTREFWIGWGRAERMAKKVMIDAFCADRRFGAKRTKPVLFAKEPGVNVVHEYADPSTAVVCEPNATVTQKRRRIQMETRVDTSLRIHSVVPPLGPAFVHACITLMGGNWCQGVNVEVWLRWHPSQGDAEPTSVRVNVLAVEPTLMVVAVPPLAPGRVQLCVVLSTELRPCSNAALYHVVDMQDQLRSVMQNMTITEHSGGGGGDASGQGGSGSGGTGGGGDGGTTGAGSNASFAGNAPPSSTFLHGGVGGGGNGSAPVMGVHARDEASTDAYSSHPLLMPHASASFPLVHSLAAQGLVEALLATSQSPSLSAEARSKALMQCDGRGRTPLMWAVRMGHANVVQALTSLTDVDVGIQVAEPVSGVTPLHVAAARGDVDSVRSLLRAGALVSAVTHRGETPAHYAAACDGETSDAVLFELVSAGASLHQGDNLGGTTAQMYVDASLDPFNDQWHVWATEDEADLPSLQAATLVSEARHVLEPGIQHGLHTRAATTGRTREDRKVVPSSDAHSLARAGVGPGQDAAPPLAPPPPPVPDPVVRAPDEGHTVQKPRVQSRKGKPRKKATPVHKPDAAPLDKSGFAGKKGTVMPLPAQPYQPAPQSPPSAPERSDVPIEMQCEEPRLAPKQERKSMRGKKKATPVYKPDAEPPPRVKGKVRHVSLSKTSFSSKPTPSPNAEQSARQESQSGGLSWWRRMRGGGGGSGGSSSTPSQGSPLPTQTSLDGGASSPSEAHEPVYQQQQQQEADFRMEDLSPMDVAHGAADACLKVVAVGDGSVGKTSLLITWVGNAFPMDYIPTVFDNFSHVVTHANKTYSLSLWDTAGQEEYSRLRSLSYPGTDVFLLCYSVNALSSFENIKSRWLPEVRHFCPGASVVLVGTKTDLRDAASDAVTITPEQGSKLATSIGAHAYVECSALRGTEVNNVFEAAIEAAQEASSPKSAPMRKGMNRPCTLL